VSAFSTIGVARALAFGPLSDRERGREMRDSILAISFSFLTEVC